MGFEGYLYQWISESWQVKILLKQSVAQSLYSLEDDSGSAKELYYSKKNEIDSEIKILEKRRKELTLSQEEKENETNKNIETLKRCYEETPEGITRDEFIKEYLECFVVSDAGVLRIVTMAYVTYVTLDILFSDKLGEIVENCGIK